MHSLTPKLLQKYTNFYISSDRLLSAISFLQLLRFAKSSSFGCSQIKSHSIYEWNLQMCVSTVRFQNLEKKSDYSLINDILDLLVLLYLFYEILHIWIYV